MSGQASGATDLTWVTEPPILYIQPDDVTTRVKRFKELLADWGSTVTGPELKKPSVSALSADLPARNPLSTQRTGATHQIADLVKKHGNGNDKPAFEYRVGGQPVALMVLYLRSDGVVEIKDLVTHPGSVDGGGIMVEFALNKIDVYNKQFGEEIFEPGLLVLESLDDESTAAYEALGFKDLGRRAMSLTAGKCDKWSRVGEKWKLVGRPGLYRAQL